MKELIIIALNDAFAALQKQTPQTKKKTMQSPSIAGIKAIDIASFMKENNIPDDACVDGKNNGYDAWDDIMLSWEIEVPTTEKDKLEYQRRVFSNIAFKRMYDLLTKNGYKRTGYNSGLLKEFDGTTVYDMYINKEFDRLVKYYSLPFNKSTN